jgi:hypothetical protein
VGKLGVLLVVALVSLGGTSAFAKGPPPPFTATASLTLTGVGTCPGSATVTWKNIKATVSRIDYTFSGGYVGGAFFMFGGSKSGSDVQSGFDVQSGASFSFTAKFYSDHGGTNLVGTATSTNSIACNA